MEWLTKAAGADRPFGNWANDLADAFVQLEPRKVSDAPFFGSISKADLAPVHISRVLGSASLRRTPALPHREGRGRFLFSQPADRWSLALGAAWPRADLRSGRSCGRRYDRTVRNHESTRLQSAMLRRAARIAAVPFFRSPATGIVVNRNGQGVGANPVRLCRSLHRLGGRSASARFGRSSAGSIVACRQVCDRRAIGARPPVRATIDDARPSGSAFRRG